MRVLFIFLFAFVLVVTPLASSAATTQLSLTISAGRQIVVDRQGRVTEVWSNITPETDSYQLLVTLDSLYGAPVAMNSDILNQYQVILNASTVLVGRLFPRQMDVEQSSPASLQVIFETLRNTEPVQSWREIVTYSP